MAKPWKSSRGKPVITSSPFLPIPTTKVLHTYASSLHILATPKDFPVTRFYADVEGPYVAAHAS